MTRILVWMEIPEDHKIFVFHDGDLTEEEADKMDSCHNQIINIQESDELTWLNEFLDTEKAKACKYEGIGPVKTADNACVIVSGFML